MDIVVTSYVDRPGRTKPSGPVSAKSSKQKLVARSSTEAELIALSDAT